MSDQKLVCPHCGHDGSAESAKSPLESFGFNYLEDDVVSREVRGFDADGKLLIDREPRATGARGMNPRIECRSCWQTFTLPAEVERAAQPEVVVGLESAEVSPQGPQPEVVPTPPPAPAVARSVAEKLADFFETALNEIRQTLASDLEKIEGRVANVTTGLGDVQNGLNTVRLRTEDLTEEQHREAEAVSEIEARLRRFEDGMPALREDVQALTAGQMDVRDEIETQLHRVVGIEDGVSRVEQLVQQYREALDLNANSARAEFAALKDRCEALERRLADETGRAESLRKELRESQEAELRRLDAQAAAIRSLHLSAEAQLRHREELRATLQKLETLAQATDIPSPLPENL
ncbi:MAG TPA: hypothetical protein VLE22_08920 [Bryobacteraceae bacterium]|nr:hypothetical protein [Bryobacteraceae bacterium]